MSKLIKTICLLLLLTGYASADMTVWFNSVDNSAALTGYKTWDVMLGTDSEWLDSEMLVGLDSGSAFQATGGSEVPPNPEDFSSDPSLEFDSFLAAGSTNYGADPAIIGGAIDIGGETPLTFDTTGVDATWCPTDNGFVGQLCMARLTLSSDASGSWSMRIANLDEGVQIFSGDITDGDMLGGTPPQDDLPGDANRDGYVDVTDLGILATNYGASGTWGWGDGDFTGDTVVDVSDLGILATNYGMGPASVAGCAVPEPVAALYLAAILLGLISFRRIRSER